MGEVCVALRENGKVKIAIVHKCLLNAFQDMRWFATDRKPHPLDALFKDASGPLAPHDYGLLVIDRDTRWMGSWQSYMGLGHIQAYASGKMVEAVKRLDIDKELAKLPQGSWSSLYMLDAVQTRILVDAWENGAILQFMDADWDDDEAQWEPISNLGTDLLPAAVDEITRLRRARSDGQCILTQTFFRFLPPGWTIEDHGVQHGCRPGAFIDTLVERGLVGAEDTQTWGLN